MNDRVKAFRLKTGVIVFFCLIILSGCSIKETVRHASDEEVIRERVMAYWGYKISEQFDKAYEFEYPLYKKSTTLLSYLRHLNPNYHWKKCEIDAVRIAEDLASVDLKITSKAAIHSPTMPRTELEFKDVMATEQWVRVDGTWYHVPKDFELAK